MGKIGAFLEITRVDAPERDPQARVEDFEEFVATVPDEELRDQGARCMECGVPFCHNGCPLGNLIPDWNDLVYRDRWREAIAQLHATNNFPEFTGRLCPAPCEAACVLEIREGNAVSIKQIEVAIVNRAWDEGWIGPQPPRVETGRTVAVIGAGPAGLAAAQQLRRAGHTVTVYERDEAGGGLIRFGVPHFKIEKWVIERRLEQLKAEGVRFEYGVDVGVDVSASELRELSARLYRVDLTAISQIRARAKDDFKRREGASLSYLPFIAKATVEALKVFPKVNATIDTEAGTITYPDAEHIGIAVDTPKGLLVPVIKDAGDLNIAGLAKKIADLASRTRSNKVTPDDLSGGTFTITNYGSAGTLMDTPFINQPQVAILGTGALVKRPVVLSVPGVGDVIAVRDMMYLSMTYDHRLVDGADAARFLSMVKARLEGGDFGSEFGL